MLVPHTVSVVLKLASVIEMVYELLLDVSVKAYELCFPQPVDCLGLVSLVYSHGIVSWLTALLHQVLRELPCWYLTQVLIDLEVWVESSYDLFSGSSYHFCHLKVSD